MKGETVILQCYNHVYSEDPLLVLINLHEMQWKLLYGLITMASLRKVSNMKAHGHQVELNFGIDRRTQYLST